MYWVKCAPNGDDFILRFDGPPEDCGERLAPPLGRQLEIECHFC
jgi:hypothetical protein